MNFLQVCELFFKFVNFQIHVFFSFVNERTNSKKYNEQRKRERAIEAKKGRERASWAGPREAAYGRQPSEPAPKRRSPPFGLRSCKLCCSGEAAQAHIFGWAISWAWFITLAGEP